jgi:hypothetical protein
MTYRLFELVAPSDLHLLRKIRAEGRFWRKAQRYDKESVILESVIRLRRKPRSLGGLTGQASNRVVRRF